MWWCFIFFDVMTLSPWPVVLCKPLALWLSAINYTVIWHRAPESPLGPLLHACSLIKVQGLVSADNPVRLALICWADDPGISSQSSDWFQRKAKQNTGQSVSVFSGLQQPYHTAAQDRLPTEGLGGLSLVSTWMGDLLRKLGCCWKRC